MKGLYSDICLSCRGEGGARVHPGPVPRHLVRGAGGVSGHVGGANRGADWGSSAPPWGSQVWLDTGVTILFFTIKFTEKWFHHTSWRGGNYKGRKILEI